MASLSLSISPSLAPHQSLHRRHSPTPPAYPKCGFHTFLSNFHGDVLRTLDVLGISWSYLAKYCPAIRLKRYGKSPSLWKCQASAWSLLLISRSSSDSSGLLVALSHKCLGIDSGSLQCKTNQLDATPSQTLLPHDFGICLHGGATPQCAQTCHTLASSSTHTRMPSNQTPCIAL